MLSVPARSGDDVIDRLYAVVGASIGGMQALSWAVQCPQRVPRCLAIGAAPLNAMGLALSHLQRVAIRSDPKWRHGNYPSDDPPAAGLGQDRVAVEGEPGRVRQQVPDRRSRRPGRLVRVEQPTLHRVERGQRDQQLGHRGPAERLGGGPGRFHQSRGRCDADRRGSRPGCDLIEWICHRPSDSVNTDIKQPRPSGSR